MEIDSEYDAWIGKQREQKPYGQREECFDCQVNYAGECKGYCELKMNEQKPFDYENANIQQKDFASKPQRMVSAEAKEYADYYSGQVTTAATEKT